MKDVHRVDTVGVRLVASTSGRVLVHPSSESSLIVEFMQGQHLDPLLIDLGTQC